MFKGEINNFLPNPGQDLPGAPPESNFKDKIGDFLPDPSQELPGGFPDSNFKGKLDDFLPDPVQQTGLSWAKKGSILRPKSGRTSWGLGFSGYQVRS